MCGSEVRVGKMRNHIPESLGFLLPVFASGLLRSISACLATSRGSWPDMFAV